MSVYNSFSDFCQKTEHWMCLWGTCFLLKENNPEEFSSEPVGLKQSKVGSNPQCICGVKNRTKKILTVYHIAPCSREQTWIQIYLTKHPIIIRMNYTLTSRAEVLNVSLGMFLFPYHLIFTAVLYLQPFSIRFEHLACFGSVLCCLVFNSDSKAND